jgi:hypothetical protein
MLAKVKYFWKGKEGLMKKNGFPVAVFCVAFCFALSLGAQDEKPYKLLSTETYMEMESVGSPAISPDGKNIIFTRAWIDKLNDRSNSSLWITDLEGKRVLVAGRPESRFYLRPGRHFPDPCHVAGHPGGRPAHPRREFSFESQLVSRRQETGFYHVHRR